MAGGIPKKKDTQIPKWGVKNPNLYGAAGAAYETTIPFLQALGMLVGGTLGSAAGPVGTAAGAGGGYAAANRLAQGVGLALGSRQPETIGRGLINTTTDTMQGTGNTMAGMIGGELAVPIVRALHAPLPDTPWLAPVTNQAGSADFLAPIKMRTVGVEPTAKHGALGVPQGPVTVRPVTLDQFKGKSAGEIERIANTHANEASHTRQALRELLTSTGLARQTLPPSPITQNIRNDLAALRSWADAYKGFSGIPEETMPMAYATAQRLYENVNRMAPAHNPADQQFLNQYRNQIDPALRYFGLVE